MIEPKYINADEFVKEKREWYCEQCLKRKGMKRGKLQFVYEIGDVPCRACDVDDVISDIEDFPAADVEPKRKWIPVTERLPEKGDTVLALFDRSDVKNIMYRVWVVHNVDADSYIETAWKDGRIVAWCPIPEPPKEEDDDEV